MSPRSRQLAERMKAKSRGAILAAALELFAKNGFAGTTTESIAKKARVSKGLVFAHFPTKEKLLSAIIDDAMVSSIATLKNVPPDASKAERLTRLVDEGFRLIQENPYLVRLILHLNLHDEYHRVSRTITRTYMNRMRELTRQAFGPDLSDHPGLDFYLLNAIFDGIAINAIAKPEPVPLEAVKQHIVRLFLSAWNQRP